jgi:predicted transcriptional regulator
MLEQLFGSQTRVKLLQLFLNNPDQSFYVRELTRIVDAQINAVRRELTNLMELGVIREIEPEDEEKKKNKMKYYQVIPDFILYPELKSMIQKTQFIIEQEFSKDIAKVGQICYLVFTGNFVGEKGIPVDILIVGNVSKSKLEAVIKKYEKQFNRDIHYTLFDMDEFTYRRNVADKFLYRILDSKKIIMIDDIFNTQMMIE